MAFFVKITKECENDADRYNQLSALNKVKNNIEIYQNLSGFESLPHTYFIKKPLSNNYRIIGYRINKDNDELILLLHILPRSSSDYRYFLKNWEENTENCIRRFVPYNDDAIDNIFNELKESPPPPQLPKPNEEEKKWLYEVFLEKKIFNSNDDLIVFETEDWVRWMSNPDNREHLLFYHQLLEGLNFDELYRASTDVEIREYWDKNRNYGIIYLYRPELNSLLLIKPIFAPQDSELLSNVCDDYTKRFSESPENNDSLIRVAVRSYPFLIILDKDSWVKIQKDEEANLALSPEEAKLLESIRNLGDNKTASYPLFINGRAGSGKSTMLQYLTADYIDFAIRNKMKHKIIYMTCSPDLLERARNIVKKLLVFHHERILKDKISENDIEEYLKNSFVVFSEFLYSLLRKEIKEKLPKEKYVDYSKFKFLWKEQFAKRPDAREISPDVAWHTIRSYIKGMRCNHDDEIDPEEFMALPRKRKSVTHEIFKNIYEKVWCSWYKRLCEEESFWDDQDLAAYVLEEGATDKLDCAAIFCDEAQDFTPIELNIIYQMSLFGKRSLSPEEIKRVPIVFAGDPLQTINPTGFSWEAVKSEFHDRFNAILDPRRKAQIDITYKDLSFNYRSNSGIVKFCNLIQLMRSAMLKSFDITPQDPWWIDKQVQVFWFNNEEIIKEGLKKRPDLVVLVNCEIGEEADFVKNDLILKNLKEHIEDVYQNVFSPTRAKGLEFPGVVLYRFIETNSINLNKLIQGKVDLDSPESKLIYEYFFNRLYVAASRAKRQVVIFDSPYAIENFWNVTYERVEELIKSTKDEGLWKNKTMTASQGKKEWWEGKTVDIKEQAEQYEKEGRKKNDPYLLRQAALSYRNLGEHFKADICIAHAYYLEGNFNKAGDLYLKNDLYEEAFKSYWRAKEWKQLQNISSKKHEFSSRLESLAADFMLQARLFYKEFIDRLNIIYDNSKTNKKEDWINEIIGDHTWNEVYQALADYISKEKEDIEIPWFKIYEIFKILKNRGLLIKDEILGMIAFRAKQFNEAVNLWEKSKYIESKEYFYAKAYTTQFPNNIYYFGLVKDYDAVLNEYNKNKIRLNELEDKINRVIFEAAIAKSELELGLKVLKEKPDSSLIEKLFIEAINNENVNVLNQAGEIAARLFVSNRDWEKAIEFIENQSFPFSKKDYDFSKKTYEKIKKIINHSQIKKAFIEEVEDTAINIIKDDIEKIIQKGKKEGEKEEEKALALAAKLLKYKPDRGKIIKLMIEATSKEKIDLIKEFLRLLTENLMQSKEWGHLIKIAEDSDFSSLLAEDLTSSDKMLFNEKIKELIKHKEILTIVTERLANSELIIKETRKNKDIVAEFLKKNFIDKETSLSITDLSPKFIGAAIERACMFEDMLKYYHNLNKSNVENKIKKFAVERLIVTYEKFAKYAKDKGQEATAKRREERAKLLRKQEGLENQNFPEFPELNETTDKKKLIPPKHRDIVETHDKKHPVSQREKNLLTKFKPTLISLKITNSIENKRLRIEKKEKLETVTIIYTNLEKIELKGDTDFSEIPREKDELYAWHINEWNVRLSVIERNDKKVVLINYNNGKIEEYSLEK